MYREDIYELIDQYNEQLEIKADARTEYQKALCILKVLAAKSSPLKSSASIDNKINSLLALDDKEEQAKAIKNHELMMIKEIEYKNARDKCDLLKLQVIEKQALRRYAYQVKE